jgi:hypothetical protein
MILKSALQVLGFDLEIARKAKKIAPDEKEKRNMLMYLLWKTAEACPIKR